MRRLFSAGFIISQGVPACKRCLQYGARKRSLIPSIGPTSSAAYSLRLDLRTKSSLIQVGTGSCRMRMCRSDLIAAFHAMHHSIVLFHAAHLLVLPLHKLASF